MKKNLLLLLLAFFFSPTMNLACTCGQSETFCETLSKHSTPINELAVLKGKVISWSFEEIEVEVLESICGNISQNNIIISLNMCTYYHDNLNMSQEGKEYLFALYQYENNFTAPSCAVWYLEVENDLVKGSITAEIKSIAYHKLNSLKSCGNAANFFSLKKYVSISPNPTIGEIRIANTSGKNPLKELKIKIFDTSGRLVQNHSKPNGILSEEPWTISLQNFPPGIYLIQLFANNTNEVFKIIKQ